MARLFGAFATANGILLLLTAGLGLMSEAYQERHVLLAVITCLLSCFIQIVVFTNLTVTGKLIGQAVHLAGLSHDWIDQSKHVKRRLTRLLGVLILSLVPAIASGASKWSSGSASSVHFGLAAFTLVVHGLVLVGEYPLIVRNQRIVDGALKAYGEFRRARAEAESQKEPAS